jgi:hypothetical protein
MAEPAQRFATMNELCGVPDLSLPTRLGQRKSSITDRVSIDAYFPAV